MFKFVFPTEFIMKFRSVSQRLHYVTELASRCNALPGICILFLSLFERMQLESGMI